MDLDMQNFIIFNSNASSNRDESSHIVNCVTNSNKDIIEDPLNDSLLICKSEANENEALNKNKTVRRYKQKVRQQWTKDPRFTDWLLLTDDDTTVQCKYCKCFLRAKFSILKEHSYSRKHLKTIQRNIHASGVQNNTEHIKDYTSDIDYDYSKYSSPINSVYPIGDLKFDHQLQITKAVISKPAPRFSGTAVINGKFQKLELIDYYGKYVVLFFYPLNFTKVPEILAFSNRIEEFRKINTQIIACSVDSHFSHLSWIKNSINNDGIGDIKIPLLSDITHSISKDYGVYLNDLGHSLKGLFIIDNHGILRQITMNDLSVDRSVDETLRVINAFQSNQKLKKY